MLVAVINGSKCWKINDCIIGILLSDVISTPAEYIGSLQLSPQPMLVSETEDGEK